MRTVKDAGPYGCPTGPGVPERRGEAPRAERCGVPRGEFATLPHKNPVFAWPPSDCIDFRQMNCLKIGAGLPARPRRAVFALFYVPSESGRGPSGETRFPPERSHGRSPYRSAERFAIFGVWGGSAHAGADHRLKYFFKSPHLFTASYRLSEQTMACDLFTSVLYWKQNKYSAFFQVNKR